MRRIAMCLALASLRVAVADPQIGAVAPSRLDGMYFRQKQIVGVMLAADVDLCARRTKLVLGFAGNGCQGLVNGFGHG